MEQVTQYQILYIEENLACVQFSNALNMGYQKMIRIPKDKAVDSEEFIKIVNDHMASTNYKLEEGLLELYPLSSD